MFDCRKCCLADDANQVVLGADDSAPGIANMEPGVGKLASPRVLQSEAMQDITETCFPKKSESFVAPRLREIEIRIQKSQGQDLGLDVDYGDTVSLKIVKVKPGLVSTHNSANPVSKMEPGDRILAVNDVRGSTDKLIGELGKGGEMKLTVERAKELEIMMTKEFEDQPIGIDIDSKVVKVLRINDGAIMNYNTAVPAHLEFFQIRPGDTIVEINGMRGGDAVITQLKSNKQLKMIVYRP